MVLVAAFVDGCWDSPKSYEEEGESNIRIVPYEQQEIQIRNGIEYNQRPSRDMC